MGFNLGLSSLQPSISPLTPSTNTSIQDVRVKDIVLDPNHPRFKEVGEWNGLGTIFFDPTTPGGQTSPTNTLVSARPMMSNVKFYPLINEIVAIVYISDPIKSQEVNESYSKLAFYLPPTNLWNSQHHNALPDSQVSNPYSKRKSTQQVENGSPNRSHINPTPILLGNTFKEKTKIFPLYPYEGDHILEGRWGNSIRLGSTVRFNSYPNDWSSEGGEGDPITIIRVNKPNPSSTQEGWLPTTENPTNDESSIYLTSTQKIPFFSSGYQTDSFGDDPSPSSPSEYQGNQILIDSGRLVLNAKQDSILLSSPNIIHLSAGNSVHLDCNDKIVLSTGKIYLIDRSASERAVLGDSLLLELQSLLPALEGLAQACTNAAAGPFPVASLILAGPVLKEALKKFKKALIGNDPTILSNKVRLQ